MKCGRPMSGCTCAAAKSRNAMSGVPGDGVVRLHRETKGRKGKGVTLIKGLDLPHAELTSLARALKTGCGVGGALRSGVIELQTMDRERIKALLEEAGFTVKLAGG